MTEQHPITPPPERFKQWEDDILNERDNVDHVLDCAWRDGFRTGADQELEACCQWVQVFADWGDLLRQDRRPKPLSLKEQALEQCNDYIDPDGIIRRALEALPDE